MAALQRLAPFGAAALLLLLLQRSQVAQSLNLILYDLVITLRPAPSGRELPITLIGISEADIATQGWPIDDVLLCEAIDKLSELGASAIGLDLYRDRGVGQEQECLRKRFRSNPRLVSIFNVAETIQAVPGTPPQRQSFNDLVLDLDGVVRRDLVHVSGQDEATVAFPLRLLEVSSGNHRLRQKLDQGDGSGPWLSNTSGGYDSVDAAGYQTMMAFRAPGSFHTWDLTSVLKGRLPAAKVKGHIVIIGSTAPSLKDLFEVPFTRFVAGEQPMLMTGVEVHANRVAALLDQLDANTSHQVIAAPGWSKTAIEVFAVILGIVLGEAFLSLRKSILVVGCVALLMIGAIVLLLFNNLWIGITMPLAGLAVMAGSSWLRRGVLSQKHRQQIEKLLGQSTSPAVAQHLWAQREELLSNGRFEGRLLPVTVVFSDTCNFTTVSEMMNPADLLKWFNRGMAICVPAITMRSGMVNKFTGDGFLAVFGAPVSMGPKQDANAAIQAVLEIQKGLEALNRELQSAGEPEMKMRIGVHSGSVLAGSMGSSERLEYAVMGDAVNCASRLESLDKDRQTSVCRILVSSATRELLETGLELGWEPWGKVSVKGRQAQLDVWELEGELKDNGLAPAQASREP
jgi:adenylate cyclase